MANDSSKIVYVVDGSFDWSLGVDSSKTLTVQTELNPNGIPRSMLVWGNNLTVRGGGITQRPGFQPLVKLPVYGRWQRGFMYEPDSANPYLVCQISGILYSVLLEAPYTVTDLTGGNPMLQNPPDAEMAFFCQGENQLVIQAGDYFTPGAVIPGKTDAAGRTLPLFWNGTTLRRSIGITTNAPASIAPHINEIPAATCMDYYQNRLWYAQARQYSAGDIAGGPSGTAPERFRDAILNVTENPLCFGGDGFTVPTNAGNIRALKHSANLNATLGQGMFFIFTRKAIYSLDVPITRTDWIAANATNAPKQTVIQITNGAVNDASIVSVNGDLFYQSFDPAIRSLITAVRNFQQWGNTPISQNELRALEPNDRALMKFSSGIEFDNRLYQLVLPQVTSDGINVVHRALLPLDFDIVSGLAQQTLVPAWEGAWDGLQFLQVFFGDFGGLPRAFSAMISDADGSINIWDLTRTSKTENGDNRVTWSPEFPAFNWSGAGLETKLKWLKGGEMWVDKISGTVEMDVYYRGDSDPCWRLWFHTSVCAARCEDFDPVCTAYPCVPFREGYKFPVVFPEPPQDCDSMGVRPSTVAYQFQVKVMLKGWCRIRGLLLYALPHAEPQYNGISCPPTGGPQGMRKLPMLEPEATPPTITCQTPPRTLT
jgi:hypothetical protein